MKWTTTVELKAQLARLWERGELLQHLVTGEARFPLRLSFKGPSSAELAEHFDLVRTWIGTLRSIPRIRIDWREINHRIHGAQRLPQAIWVDDLDDALAWVGKRHEAAGFQDILSLTRSSAPELLPWLARRPLQAAELATAWSRLLDVVSWMKRHPRPGIYLRQVDIAGIHSKFIEAHRGVLAELFDLALPTAAIDAERTGLGQFATRYGFLGKPARVRLRVLDPRVQLVSGTACPDVTLDVVSLARVDVLVRRVFITENETNFLAFPTAAEAIVIFGAGYGWESLSRTDWLRQCAIHYWGDIDTHGFAILDQLRRIFPHVESFLMDRQTLMAHESLWGTEPDQVVHDLPKLTDAERSLFDELRDNRIRNSLRLEQEMVGFSHLADAVVRLVSR